MIIRILGLMSEDEKIQDEIMKDSDRLFGFVGLTIKRAADSLKKAKGDYSSEKLGILKYFPIVSQKNFEKFTNKLSVKGFGPLV